ncbi:dimethyladenosine transferase 2, mitochondrial-like [Pollicipes pollicipes]|nr:dimethyladenosine transferase 2, mitochondrial-like [Pollicipes pollicipes]
MWGAATHGQEARLQQALDGLSWRPWHQGPCLRVVGVAHRSTFFRYLVRTVVEREHLFQFGRPELVVYVPSSEVERLTSSPDMSGRAYRPYSILSQIFFDLELLRRVPAKHFYPWMMARKRVSFTDMDMVLIRYTPKVDPGLPDSELPNLDFFIRHCTVSKRRRIVPQLE